MASQLVSRFPQVLTHFQGQNCNYANFRVAFEFFEILGSAISSIEVAGPRVICRNFAHESSDILAAWVNFGIRRTIADVTYVFFLFLGQTHAGTLDLRAGRADSGNGLRKRERECETHENRSGTGVAAYANSSGRNGE